MGLLDAVLGADADIDDPRVLPMELISVYQNPYRTLGLDETATIAQIRDSFRRSCISLIDEFSGLHHPKITLLQIHVAYHLCRKILKGPAKKLLQDIEKSPYLQKILATDILPILRPVHSSFDCPPEYRGFRFFSIHFVGHRIDFTIGKFPTILYKFDVHYCMRTYTVEHEYEQVYNLHQEFSKELLLVPAFPTRANLSSYDIIGHDLGEYMRRVYSILTNKGVFSPRLLHFLKIPYEQVQSEEEGQIVQILDTTELPPQTVFHIVDEDWLAKWRRFVLGRDARRYAPPGPITNYVLFDPTWKPHSDKKHKRPVKQGLVIAKDYRVVNYNVWHFYQRVHGGGPIIGRKFADILSNRALSRLQALILIQGRCRCFIAKKKLDKLYTSKFSSSFIAKKIMTTASEGELKSVVEKRIQECTKDRREEKVESAARLTQNLWRNKKRYIPEENLARRKRDQEVFARAKVIKRAEGVSEEVKSGEGLVVTDVHPIVHIGNTGIYHRVLTEEGGIPFSLAREPGSNTAIIEKKSGDGAEGVSTDGAEFKEGSKLIAINHIPTASLTYEETKAKLKAATFPLHLELSLPADEKFVKEIQKKLGDDSELAFRSFKLLLAIAPDKDGNPRNGIRLRKHDTKGNGFHDSAIYISDTELFYKKKRHENAWVGMSLYSLRYVRGGDETPNLTARFGKKKGVVLNHFFELVTTSRSYIFEVLSSDLDPDSAAKQQTKPSENTQNNIDENRSPDSPSKSSRNGTGRNSSTSSSTPPISPQVRGLRASYTMGSLSSQSFNFSQSILHRNTETTSVNVENDPLTKEARQLVEGLKQLIAEAKGSQWFVSKDGVPMRRAKPKTTLRKIM